MRSWSTAGRNIIIQVLSGRSNVFLLTNGQASMLIDTGPAFMWKILQKKLAKLRIEQINFLFLTHSHFDHAANASGIKEKYKTKVIIHQSEAECLNKGCNILPSGTNFITKFLVKTFARQFSSVTGYQPCNPDITFENTFDLSSAGFKACLLHTPGHTPGSASLIVDNEVALVGDTMFGVFPGSVFPPYALDQKQMLDSWEKLLETQCRLFIPSHGSANKRSLVEKDLNKRRTNP